MNSSEKSGVSTLFVKDLNTKTVLNTLKHARTATVRDLAAASGLSTVTVKGILNKLVEQHQAVPDGMAPSSGGRPSQRYRFNEQFMLGLLLYAREIDGKDSVCLRVADLYGDILDAADHEMPHIRSEDIEALIAEKIEAYPRIQAVGIGLPGIEYQGSIVSLDYKSLIGMPIIRQMQSRFGLPVVFENDVNAAVLGRSGNDSPEGTEIYIYFPRKYPPGAGIRVNGKLIKGSRHFAGEVGYLPLGIRWGEETADSFEDCSSAAAQVIISLTAVLDPDSVVLYGEHITNSHLERIREICRSQLPGHVLENLTCSGDFSADFEQGLKYLILNLLER